MIVSIYLLYRFIKGQKDKNTFEALKQSNEPSKRANLAADKITMALGTNKSRLWYQGFTEDESSAIAIIKQNIDLFFEIESLYQVKNIKESSLKSDLERYLSTNEFDKLLIFIDKYS